MVTQRLVLTEWKPQLQGTCADLSLRFIYRPTFIITKPPSIFCQVIYQPKKSCRTQTKQEKAIRNSKQHYVYNRLLLAMPIFPLPPPLSASYHISQTRSLSNYLKINLTCDYWRKWRTKTSVVLGKSYIFTNLVFFPEGLTSWSWRIIRSFVWNLIIRFLSSRFGLCVVSK